MKWGVGQQQTHQGACKVDKQGLYLLQKITWRAVHVYRMLRELHIQ